MFEAFLIMVFAKIVKDSLLTTKLSSTIGSHLLALLLCSMKEGIEIGK